MNLVDSGYENVWGNRQKSCPHMKQWLTVFEKYVRTKYGEKLEITQIAGNYSASGGTHREGTCIDLRNTNLVEVARTHGAPASWVRGPAAATYHPSNRKAITAFSTHLHCHILCPCRSSADYQTRHVFAGYDGLASAGRDYHQKPPHRNWQQGIALMNQEIDQHNIHKATTHATERDIENMHAGKYNEGKDTIYVLFNEESGFFSKVKTNSATYMKPILDAWKTGPAVPITASHANELQRACKAIK